MRSGDGRIGWNGYGFQDDFDREDDPMDWDDMMILRDWIGDSGLGMMDEDGEGILWILGWIVRWERGNGSGDGYRGFGWIGKGLRIDRFMEELDMGGFRG